MEIKTWIVRLLLIIPLLSSLYCLISVFGSSQGKLCKGLQTLWLILAVLMSVTVVEFPEMLFTKKSDFHSEKQKGPFSTRYAIVIQISHYLAFLLLQTYHLLVYSFLMTYWQSYFAHLPVIAIVIRSVATARDPSLTQFLNRTNQILTGLLMICTCGQVRNVCGVLGAVVMLVCFFYVNKPTRIIQLDKVYWCLIGIYFSIAMHSFAIQSMIENPNIFVNPLPDLWSI